MLGQTMLREMPPGAGGLDPIRQMQRTQADLNRLFGGLRFYRRRGIPPAESLDEPGWGDRRRGGSRRRAGGSRHHHPARYRDPAGKPAFAADR